MGSDTWKYLSINLSEVAQFLPSPADKAVGLTCKLASLTYDVMEAKGKHQQLVQQLSERALIVSRMIEKYVAECRPQNSDFTTYTSSFRGRPQNSDFTTYASSFRATMDDVIVFVEKCVHQTWMDRLWNDNSQVKSEFENLWRRLDAHAADYRGYLLLNIVSRGPSERIDHPRLRDFWGQNMNNVFEATWSHFWEQLQHEFPRVRQSLSGPGASTYKMKLQARAIPYDAQPRDAKFVGPWEINNLFQPPTSSIDQIVRTLIGHEERATVVAKAAQAIVVAKEGPAVVVATPIPSAHKISIEASTAVHCWTGYSIKGTYKAVLIVELSFGANHRIYGGGSDEIGDFTCKGERLGTKVHFVQQYVGLHQVEYDGAISNTTINGIWKKDRGLSSRGAFTLKKQPCAEFVPNCKEARILQVGEMQHWKGYYTDRGRKIEGSADICFTESHKIYGSGMDNLGYFTLIGRYHKGSHSTLLNITKQYDTVYYLGANTVYYVGAITHSFCVGREDPKVVIEGTWALSNNLHQGTFSLQPDGNN